MYKVKPDGSIECLTAEEAIELQRLIQSKRAEPSQAKRRRSVMNGNESAAGIAKQLQPYNGKEISSAQLMPIIGAKSPFGIGPKIYQLGQRVSLDDHVTLSRHRDEKGVAVWKVKVK